MFETRVIITVLSLACVGLEGDLPREGQQKPCEPA